MLWLEGQKYEFMSSSLTNVEAYFGYICCIFKVEVITRGLLGYTYIPHKSVCSMYMNE